MFLLCKSRQHFWLNIATVQASKSRVHLCKLKMVANRIINDFRIISGLSSTHGISLCNGLTHRMEYLVYEGQVTPL